MRINHSFSFSITNNFPLIFSTLYIYLGYSVVKRVDNVKFLVVHVDFSLTCIYHIIHVTEFLTKITFIMHKLKHENINSSLLLSIIPVCMKIYYIVWLDGEPQTKFLWIRYFLLRKSSLVWYDISHLENILIQYSLKIKYFSSKMLQITSVCFSCIKVCFPKVIQHCLLFMLIQPITRDILICVIYVFHILQPITVGNL